MTIEMVIALLCVGIVGVWMIVLMNVFTAILKLPALLERIARILEEPK